MRAICLIAVVVFALFYAGAGYAQMAVLEIFTPDELNLIRKNQDTAGILKAKISECYECSGTQKLLALKPGRKTEETVLCPDPYQVIKLALLAGGDLDDIVRAATEACVPAGVIAQAAIDAGVLPETVVRSMGYSSPDVQSPAQIVLGLPGGSSEGVAVSPAGF